VLSLHSLTTRPYKPLQTLELSTFPPGTLSGLLHPQNNDGPTIYQLNHSFLHSRSQRLVPNLIESRSARFLLQYHDIHFDWDSSPLPRPDENMLETQVPSRPRAQRNVNPPRGPSRGGIGKRSSRPTRTDKDGDLVMNASGSGRGTPRSAGRGRGGSSTPSGPSRGGIRSKPSRPAVNPAALQKAIARGLNTGAAVVRNADGSDRRNLEELSVEGWKKSKAAAKSDGGVKQLLDFLERKATPPNSTSNEKVRIRKVCYSLQSAGHQRDCNSCFTVPLSFQANLSERRPWVFSVAAAFG
jgi:hypothetical protein